MNCPLEWTVSATQKRIDNQYCSHIWTTGAELTHSPTDIWEEQVYSSLPCTISLVGHRSFLVPVSFLPDPCRSVWYLSTLHVCPGCRDAAALRALAVCPGCCSTPPTSLLAPWSQGEEKVSTPWKWIILPPSLQGWEGYWDQPCGLHPLPLLPALCPLLWVLAPRCGAEMQHQCGKCSVEPRSGGQPEPSQVQYKPKGAKLNQRELSQKELSWWNLSRARWSRVEQPEAAVLVAATWN